MSPRSPATTTLCCLYRLPQPPRGNGAPSLATTTDSDVTASRRLPTGTYFTDLCGHRADRLASSNHYRRQGALFLATTTNSGVNATVSADQLGHISPFPAATVAIDLPLQATTNRPRRKLPSPTTSPSALSVPANTPSFTPRKIHRHEHRRHLHRPTFMDYCSVDGRVYMHAAGRAYFIASYATATFAQPYGTTTASSSTVMVLLPHHPRTPYLHRFALGALQRSRSRPPLAFCRTIDRLQRSYCIFRVHHDVTVSRSERRSALLYDHRPRFIGFFFKPVRHPIPRPTYLFFCTLLLSSFWTSRGHRCRPSSPGSCLRFLSRIGFSNLTARRIFINCCC